MATNRDQDDRDLRRIRGVSQQQQYEALPTEDRYTHPGINLLEERNQRRRQLGMELRELDSKIETSDGYWLYNRMSLLEKSYFVFDVNRLNLKHILEEFEQPMTFLKLWEEKNRDRFDMFMNDIIRLFHNYLAGAATLLDHMRTLQGEVYRGTEFSEEYRTQWDRQFKEAALPQFIEDLLVYTLHKGLPFALAELNFGGMGNGVEVNSSIRLDVRKLGEWERWSERGREHLDRLDDKAKLVEVIEEHASVVGGFYRWFVGRQGELNQEAAQELEELKSKRGNLLQEIRGLEDVLESAEKSTIEMREERDKLARELEAERQYRAWDKERAEKLEAQLNAERNRGFFRRLFGRR